MRDRLRRVLEAVGGEPCLRKQMAFDIAGHRFRFSVWRLGPATVIQVVRPESLQRHMRAPSVVPTFEFGAHKRRMVKSLDERDASEPFVFKRLDDPFGDSNGPTLAHGAEAGFDVPLIQQLGKSTSGKDRRFSLRWCTRPEERAASKAARMSRETAVLRISRFSAMVPPPRVHRATEADSKGHYSVRRRQNGSAQPRAHNCL